MLRHSQVEAEARGGCQKAHFCQPDQGAQQAVLVPLPEASLELACSHRTAIGEDTKELGQFVAREKETLGKGVRREFQRVEQAVFPPG